MRSVELPDGTTITNPALGCMFFGTLVTPEASYAVLDRYLEAGGRLIDTANNYAFWVEGGTGDESETLLGRWLAERGNRDEVVLATKLGARPRLGGSGTSDGLGLGADAVREQLDDSLRRLGVDHVDLLYAHVDDASVPLEETLGAFDDLVASGKVGSVAASNLSADRLREAWGISDEHGWPRYQAVQQRVSYLTPRDDADFGVQRLVDDDLLDTGAIVIGYSTLLSGAYAGRADRPVPEAYRHDRTDAQLAAVHEVADRLGLTPNQVVLSWLMHGPRPIVPLLGASRVEQLDELLAADPDRLDDEAMTTLDTARGPLRH